MCWYFCRPTAQIKSFGRHEFSSRLTAKAANELLASCPLVGYPDRNAAHLQCIGSALQCNTSVHCKTSEVHMLRAMHLRVKCDAL